MPNCQGTAEPTVALDDLVRKQLAALAQTVGEAAAYALVAAGVKGLPDDAKWPDEVTFWRFAGPTQPPVTQLFSQEAFGEIRSDFANFGAQCSLLWMVAGLEECGAILLMVVRLAREQRGGVMDTRRHDCVVRETLERVRGASAMGLLHQAYDVVDGGCRGPDRMTKPFLRRLDSIVRVRNYVAHRRGWVVPQFDLDDADSLRVAFLRPIVSYEGKEISEPTLLEGPGQLVLQFRECERKWKPGEQVRLNAEELQAVAMTIYLDAGKVADEVLAYLRRRLGVVNAGNAREPGAAEA